ncbi:MAG: hypothetical protein IT548_15170 [Alphaproteobacteria bacterium]|nr:hypothetical protein [Alphaproteobacteria bacterium]
MIVPRWVRMGLWGLFGVAAVVVTYYSLRPGNSGFTFLWSDKIQHASAYATLSGLATLAARTQRQAIQVAIGLAVLGFVFECIQPSVGRSFDLLDEAANIAGCAIGTFAGFMFLRIAGARRAA